MPPRRLSAGQPRTASPAVVDNQALLTKSGSQSSAMAALDTIDARDVPPGGGPHARIASARPQHGRAGRCPSFLRLCINGLGSENTRLIGGTNRREPPRARVLADASCAIWLACGTTIRAAGVELLNRDRVGGRQDSRGMCCSEIAPDGHHVTFAAEQKQHGRAHYLQSSAARPHLDCAEVVGPRPCVWHAREPAPHPSGRAGKRCSARRSGVKNWTTHTSADVATKMPDLGVHRTSIERVLNHRSATTAGRRHLHSHSTHRVCPAGVVSRHPSAAGPGGNRPRYPYAPHGGVLIPTAALWLTKYFEREDREGPRATGPADSPGLCQQPRVRLKSMTTRPPTGGRGWLCML